MITKEKPKFINGFILWIGASSLNNLEHKAYLKSIQEHPLYKKFNLKIYCFENLEIAFEFIINFKDTIMIFILI